MIKVSEVYDHFRKAEKYHRERIGTVKDSLP